MSPVTGTDVKADGVGFQKTVDEWDFRLKLVAANFPDRNPERETIRPQLARKSAFSAQDPILFAHTTLIPSVRDEISTQLAIYSFRDIP